MKRLSVLLTFLSLLLSSCSLIQMGIEPAIQATATQAVIPSAETPALIPSQAAIPTEFLPSPTIQPELPTEIVPAVTATPQLVKIFMIAMEDNGQSGPLVGCGDSAVAVQVEIQPTQSVLRAALEALFAVRTRDYGQSGLYNALYQSSLKLDRVALENGEAFVDISGQMQLGGECDDPRVEAQITQTVMQFSTINRASITLNGKPLHEALSLK